MIGKLKIESQKHNKNKLAINFAIKSVEGEILFWKNRGIIQFEFYHVLSPQIGIHCGSKSLQNNHLVVAGDDGLCAGFLQFSPGTWADQIVGARRFKIPRPSTNDDGQVWRINQKRKCNSCYAKKYFNSGNYGKNVDYSWSCQKYHIQRGTSRSTKTWWRLFQVSFSFRTQSILI